MYHTYTAERKLFSVPGNNSYSCGVGTIKLRVHNKVTNQYDVVVLTRVSHLRNAPNLISTGKLNKIDLHMDTVKNELFHVKSDKHKYNIKVSDDDLTVLPCLTGNTSGPVYSETDHLISNQGLHISQTGKQFGFSGRNINNASSSSEKESSYADYQSDIKLNPELFTALNKKYGPFEMELFASDTNNLLDQYITAKQNSFLTEWTKRF